MQLSKLFIDGYGRFCGREIELQPGLQVIVGPNEQGKTTLRHFITDMLYGQKRSATQRLYDEANELRRPWNDPDTYGGRLTYRLDEGREIEVQRNFERRNESVYIYDLTHARDITREFEVLRNREPLFAEKHLGISKAVFVNTATIGHASLDQLGDDEALGQIREKILSLADSGDETGSSESAIRYLEARIGVIGKPVANSRRPLPLSRARLAQVEEEYRLALAIQREVQQVENRRLAVIAELNQLRERRDALDLELHSLDHAERVKRLEDAEALSKRIHDATQKCFSLSRVREFPVDNGPEVQRTANVVATARAQVERTRNEIAQLEQRFHEEEDRLGANGSPTLAEIPEDSEQRLAELETSIARIKERLETLEQSRAATSDRLAQAQEELDSLPDFSQIAADPVEWLQQTASGFHLAVQQREAEKRRLAEMKRELEMIEGDIAQPTIIFSAFEDFSAQARDYEIQSRVWEEKSKEYRNRIEEYQTHAEELNEHTPGYMWGSIFMSVLTIGLVLGAIFLELQLMFISASISAVAAAGAFLAWVYSQRRVQKEMARAEFAQDELHEMEEEFSEQRDKMDSAVRMAGYESVRELEALYDRYVKLAADRDGLSMKVEAQEALVRREDDFTARQLARIQEQFQQVGAEVHHEQDVQAAATRAIARYQEYRDAKRRVMENRSRPTQLDQELEALREEFEALRQEDIDLSLGVRKLMRDSGFRDEKNHASALSALRAYRIRTANVREKVGRVNALSEQMESTRARLLAEEEDLLAQEKKLQAVLKEAGATSIDHYHKLAQDAKVYRESWDERVRSEEKLEALLRGESLEALRLSVEEAPQAVVPSGRASAEIKNEWAEISDRMEALAKEEHALHIELAQRNAGARSLNELEEDRANLAERLAALQREFDAAVHAAALIEDIARNRHARIAPRLASLASDYLSAITGGAYGELLLNRDLVISVRIPQTERLAEDPERSLSKGTVDQIYLALRLALVHCIGEGGETIPLLLDDPFANYDDNRLATALGLLKTVAESNQVLLFTCRQDVSRAAHGLQVPVIEL
ncbi:MAG: hypothetical protein AMXMBFR84_40870 [Candidatus Hydrogenedentota bacterium]